MKTLPEHVQTPFSHFIKKKTASKMQQQGEDVQNAVTFCETHNRLG